MFKKFFNNEEKEEVFEKVDPVLEQRRKEKFSTPLIYNEDKPTEQPVERKDVEKKPTVTTTSDSQYSMSQIISPISGVQDSGQSEPKVIKPKQKKLKKESEHLIPIISPFYGPTGQNDEDEDDESEDAQLTNVKSVDDNIRNIAKIAEEEKEQLKIIEERTGEFKLDFRDDKETFIDEIEDSMSLDELMSLYEKKFKD